MHVIRHDEIEPHRPRVGIGAGGDKGIAEHGVGQTGAARLNRERHEEDDRDVVSFDRRRVNRPFATGQFNRLAGTLALHLDESRRFWIASR